MVCLSHHHHFQCIVGSMRWECESELCHSTWSRLVTYLSPDHKQQPPRHNPTLPFAGFQYYPPASVVGSASRTKPQHPLGIAATKHVVIHPSTWYSPLDYYRGIQEGSQEFTETWGLLPCIERSLGLVGIRVARLKPTRSGDRQDGTDGLIAKMLRRWRIDLGLVGSGWWVGG